MIAAGLMVGLSAGLSSIVWMWSLIQGDYRSRCSLLLAASLALVALYALAYP